MLLPSGCPRLASHICDVIAVSQVRLKVLRKLGNVTSAITTEMLTTSILPMIVALSADSQWRVREQIIEQMPGLAEGMVSYRRM